jgi:hypothetical protein
MLGAELPSGDLLDMSVRRKWQFVRVRGGRQKKKRA